jgi:uncharacterized protein (DUF952 family)
MIYHITSKKDWETAKNGGFYTADSLASEGFIHCSTATQVEVTANRFFNGKQDLVILEIDPQKVAAEIKFENLEGGREQFPHVYGKVPLEAIDRAIEIHPDSAGKFSIHLQN